MRHVFDNTENVKQEAARNTRVINAIEAQVAPIPRFETPVCRKGKMAYSVNGGKVSKVEKIVDKDTIVIRGEFRRAEEWKPTPWTEEEKQAYFSHRQKESLRVKNETKNVLRNLREMDELAKEFLR